MARQFCFEINWSLATVEFWLKKRLGTFRNMMTQHGCINAAVCINMSKPKIPLTVINSTYKISTTFTITVTVSFTKTTGIGSCTTVPTPINGSTSCSFCQISGNVENFRLLIVKQAKFRNYDSIFEWPHLNSWAWLSLVVKKQGQRSM